MTSYAYQTRRNADAAWTTLAADPWAWTNGIAEDMQRAGLRYSELALHLEDMRNGEVLTADGGQQFRAVDAAKAKAEAVAANQADYAAWKAAQTAPQTAPQVAPQAPRTFRVSPGQSGSDAGKWLVYRANGWLAARFDTEAEALEYVAFKTCPGGACECHAPRDGARYVPEHGSLA